MIVSLKTEFAIARKEVFQIEITDKSGLRSRFIAVSEIAVEQEAIVEET